MCEAAMGEEKKNVDGVWVCEFEVWVLWVFKNDLVAGVSCCVVVGLWWWQKREKR